LNVTTSQTALRNRHSWRPQVPDDARAALEDDRFFGSQVSFDCTANDDASRINVAGNKTARFDEHLARALDFALDMARDFDVA
jgi:hypothetical protein